MDYFYKVVEHFDILNVFMKIYKFGGASVKDVEGIKNLGEIISNYNSGNLSIVVSAIGKTTRELMKVLDFYLDGDLHSSKNHINTIFQFHRSIIFQLFNDNADSCLNVVNILEKELLGFINLNKSPKKAFVFDQIVQYGELLSTVIISEYLNSIGIKNTWLDARNIIKTDSSHRDAKVDWDSTLKNVKANIKPNEVSVIQGFIGSDENNFTTTLGLEGSDYSAAILAYCLNADNITVWKDVDGILNADPRFFNNASLINELSFREAIELSYYGATVIHPKTIQPLQHKEIPLYVKNFNHPQKEGTVIKKGSLMEPLMPCYIIKKNQILLSISTLDFSFVVEENMSEIFTLLSDLRIKVNLMQNSAISFTLALEDKFETFGKLLESLKSKYRLKYNYDVNLYTIRHYSDNSLKYFEEGKNILLKQFSRETAQYIVK